MFSRKHQDEMGTELPTTWLNQISSTLNDFFAEKLAEHDYFDCHAEIFSDELILIVSKTNTQNRGLPISLFLSLDLSPELFQNIKKIKPLVDEMVDLCGYFFEETFEDQEWEDYQPNWQEYKHKKNQYYYKITRESIELSLEASRLLKN